MISPSLVKKVKYTLDSENQFVKLDEYVLFEDDRDDEKYIIFKFKNCVDQWLHEIKFVVNEYNKDDELILTSAISYKEANIKEHSSFVPSAKYRASGDCDHIKVDIEYALFEKMEYSLGAVKNLDYDYTDYKNEVSKNVSGTKTGNKFQGYIKPTFASDTKVKGKKKKISIKDITHLNRPRALRTFLFITTLFSILLFIFAAAFYDYSSNEFVYGQYELALVQNSTTGGQEVHIISYIGTSQEVTLPSSVVYKNNTYNVTQVETNAFKNNSNIQKVFVSSQYVFNRYTFNNCPNLTEIRVTSNGKLTIESYAFINCDNVSQITGNNIILKQQALTGLPNFNN